MRPLKTMNAEELSELPFPPPAFIVKDLIPHGLSVLAGASKTGKSWLVLWLAMRVSQGLPVWERPTQQCEVLYLCLEDTFPYNGPRKLDHRFEKVRERGRMLRSKKKGAKPWHTDSMQRNSKRTWSWR